MQLQDNQSVQTRSHGPGISPAYPQLLHRLNLFLATAALYGSLFPASAVPGNTNLVQQADGLLSRMTLEEKIGQMSQFTLNATITGPTGERQDLPALISQGRCGSVFNASTVAKIREYQTIAVDRSRLKIPLLFGLDVIHGYKTIFPVPLGESASWDLATLERSARIAAIEASAGGLNWTFAPMVDIARDPRWGRVVEGAGEDPYLGAEIAKARVRGFQGDLSDASCIAACVKHFAAYGAVQAGRDYNSVDMSERMLREVYLPPYKAALDAGALTVMSAFNDLNGVPCTANRWLLTQILKQEWGFSGFVVSDFNSVNELLKHGVAADLPQTAQLALEAGLDMDMQGGVYADYLHGLVAQHPRLLPAINDAVRRILTCKYKLGLMADPYRYCDEQRETNRMLTSEHLEAAYEAASRSLVLLKNQARTLPLKKGLSLAVVGPLADARYDLLGSWTAKAEVKAVHTILESLRAANPEGRVLFTKGCDVASTNRSQFGQAFAAAQQSDAVVLVLGESAHMSGEANSRTSLNLPGVQTELLRELKKAGKPIVLILINGRPLTLEEESGVADAILEAWQPGTEGGRAVADALFGRRNPSGKLPITFPRRLGQVPLFYSMKNTGRPFDPARPSNYKSTYNDCPNDPLYPFGYGLSYTTYHYSEVTLDKSALKPGEQLTVSVTVTNTGERAGTEIVQLYLRNLVASVTRPVLELKGFQRIELQPGESRRVSFSVGEMELTFLRQDLTWGTEPGSYQVFIGSSSKDLRSATFRWNAN
jgi:beta-glucosidase